jgi:hypothetical protein
MSELSRRDYFAAAALTGLLMQGPYNLSIEDAVSGIAHASYALADAMIEAGRPEFEKAAAAMGASVTRA